MSKKVTLKQMRYFVSAARTGRFSMAALQEHVSQSAITNAVLELEQHLDVRLFNRLQYGVSLTEAGQDFLRQATFILEAVNEATTQVKTKNIKGIKGKIRLGASYTMLGYFLPELIARFKKSNPNILIDLIDLNLKEMEQALRAQHIDVGIGLVSNLSHKAPYDTHLLVRSPRKLWVSPTHPLGTYEKVCLADIAPFPYILVTVDDAEYFTRELWDKSGYSPNYVLKTGSLESVRGFVAQGLGVSILADMVYRPWSLEGKKINTLLIDDHVPDLEAGAFWLKHKKLNKASEAFCQFLGYASTT